MRFQLHMNRAHAVTQLLSPLNRICASTRHARGECTLAMMPVTLIHMAFEAEGDDEKHSNREEQASR